MLNLGTLPLNGAIQRLLGLAERATGGAVEIELAIDIGADAQEPARLGFLQMRPMAVSAGESFLTGTDLGAPGVVVAAHQALGHGRRDDLTDVVYVEPGGFDPARTRQIADELGEHNRRLLESGRPYVLIGFGRWGTSDPWLGIPVDWGQIAGARVLVEAALPQMQPDVSQGSHFFHNLIGFEVFYLATGRGDGTPIDWAWLEKQPEIARTAHVRHVRTDTPLDVAVDGLQGLGVIRHA
jgi:hypothetical protein